MRRAQLQPLTAAIIDSVTPTALKSGVTFIAGDVQISNDRGAFANVTNLPVEIGSSGVYGFDLTAAESNCSWICIKFAKSGIVTRVGEGALDSQPTAAVVADGGNTTTTFVTNLTEASSEFWKGAGIVFTSGALKGQVREVASYNGNTKALTLAVALTAVPAAGDAFTIING